MHCIRSLEERYLLSMLSGDLNLKLIVMHLPASCACGIMGGCHGPSQPASQKARDCPPEICHHSNISSAAKICSCKQVHAYAVCMQLLWS